MDRSKFDEVRDGIAWGICNLVLKHIATAYYRDRIGQLIQYGMDASIRDSVDAPLA